jgi:peptidoglycan/xylan/chitin deacetylase (PgdA/CDA1 family)
VQLVAMRPRVASGLALMAVASLSVGVVLGMYLPAPANQVAAQALASATPFPRATPTLVAIPVATPKPRASSSAVSSATPDATGTPAATHVVKGSVTVPILYYQRVEKPPDAFAWWTPDQQRAFLRYDVLPVALAGQLDWLDANGYTTILPRDLAAHWDKGAKLPKKPVILTFDDGTADWAKTVEPLLRRHGMVAEFYVTLENIGAQLSWNDLRGLAAAGNRIGAHAVHHVQLAALGQGIDPASAATMRSEVMDSRNEITTRIGAKPDSFAYVGGGYDATLEEIVRKAGFTTARSLRGGVTQEPGLRYELRVVRIGAYDDIQDMFAGTLVPGLPTFQERVTGRDPG